jgi:hypothetical protein
MLSVRFPDVEYRFVEENLGPEARKTPSFAAVLNGLDPDEPVGIINADIFTALVPDLAARTAKAAAEAVLIGHRWEVPSLAARRGKRFDLGVDFIAFTPRKIAPAIESFAKLPYQLGVPWWDYAFPTACSLYQPLSLIDDPIFLHHTHENAWSMVEWHRFAAITLDYLKARAEDPAADRRIARELKARLARLEHDYRDNPRPKEKDYALAELTLRWVHVMSERRPLSLVSEMALPPTGLDLDDPWVKALPESLKPLFELPDTEAAANSAEPAVAPAVLSRMPRREFKAPPFLALFKDVSTESSPAKVVGAGFRDLGLVALATGKLLERRVRRRFRPGHGARPQAEPKR